MDKDKTLLRVYKLKQLFDNGQIPQQHKHEVNPDLPREDRLNYLYFTLPVCINYQRSSPAMWASALNTFNDPKTNYLFYPEKVVEKDFTQLQKDLVKHKLALQKNKHVEIWQRISQALFDGYNSDPRQVLQAGEMDVSKIIENISVKEKKKFPYLSGAKMSNYWIYILHNFTDAQFVNLSRVSIIPDTHVQQCTSVLGLTQEGASPVEVAEKWFELLDGTGLNPIDLHPILWNWSRANFQPPV